MTKISTTHDVIVYDEEHRASSAIIDNALQQLDELFANYVETLASLSSNGTIFGEAGEALQAYAEEAAAVQKAVSKIAAAHKRTSGCFLADVDEADQDLF